MRLITLGFGVLFAVAACGGSTDEGLSGTGGKTGTGGAAGSGASAGSGGVAGAAGASSGGAGGAAGGGGTNTGGSAGYTLENVCDKTQPQGCEWAKACCTQSGFGYDQAGCVKNALGDCQQNVADVKAGKAQAIGFLTGQVMRQTRGQANAAVVGRLLREALEEV